MNDSKEFQDAESVRSGNPHVTSPPGLFPRHPPFEGLMRQTKEPPNVRDTSGISGNVFAHPHYEIVEDFNSSTESTSSTSLVHCIASVRN